MDALKDDWDLVRRLRGASHGGKRGLDLRFRLRGTLGVTHFDWMEGGEVGGAVKSGRGIFASIVRRTSAMVRNR